MTTNPNDPAFPYSHNPDVVQQYSGITQRNYFAAHALEGLCAQPAWTGDGPTLIATEAFHIADAMLARLNAAQPESATAAQPVAVNWSLDGVIFSPAFREGIKAKASVRP